MSLFDLFTNTNIHYISSNDLEEKRSFTFLENINAFQEIPTFTKKAEKYTIDLTPSHGNTIKDGLENYFDNENSIDRGILTEEYNSCHNIFMHEIPKVSNETKNFSSESQSKKIEIIIESEPGNSTIKKEVNISKGSQVHIFGFGKCDYYSSKIIGESLNEMSQLKEKTKKSKKRKKRKENKDNIIKKIKNKFFKSLKNIINQKLKDAGSEKTFGFFPQSLISDLTKEENIALFNLDLEDIYLGNFYYKKNDKKSEKNLKEKNKKVLEYLAKNKTISEKSCFNLFKNMKLSEIYKQYLNSEEFENAIISFNQETTKYIKSYIINAYDFLKIIKNN